MSEEVIGLQDLLTKMEALPLTIGKVLIVRALRAAADPIEARASQLAPDDANTPGSRIRDNMMTTVTNQTATEAIAKIGPSKKGFVGSFQEFGTAHNPAQPFLRPAFDEQQAEALRIMGESLAAGIEAELAKQ